MGIRKLRLKRYVLVPTTSFLIIVLVYIVLALTKPLPQISAPSQAISHPASTSVVAWPTGVYAAVGSLNEGRLASSSTDEQPRSIASIAKIITALAVITKKPITATGDNVITFTTGDEAIYHQYLAEDGSSVPIKAGDQLSEYHALEAMLVPSGNNIADSLATWAFGSMDAYSAYANDMVRSFGLTKTTVGEASGFNDTTLSTPSDLIVLGQKLLQNNILAEIVQIKNDTLPEIGIAIHNTNQLLQSDVGGIKTGHTIQAGYCLLLVKAYKLGNGQSTEIISAVLGAPTSDESFTYSDALIDSIKQDFAGIVLVSKNQVVGTYITPWGSKSDIVANDNVLVYGWLYKARYAQTYPKVITVPQEGGSTVGTITAHNDGGVTTSVSLSLKNALELPSTYWRLTHYF